MEDSRSQTETSRAKAATEAAPAAAQIDHLGYARLLGNVDLFAGLEKVTLAALAAHLRPLSYKSGSFIFRQAEPGDAFYLVVSGSVGVYAMDKHHATQTRVNILHAGEPFGEMALLTNRPRAASIKAESDCEVLRLERSAFHDLVRREPSVALAVAGILSRRLAGMLHQPHESDAEVAAAAQLQSGEDTVAAATAAATRSRWKPGRGWLALVVAIVMLGVGWTVPPPLGLSAVAWHALVVLLAALPALMLDVLLEGVLALLLVAAWVLFGITTPDVALAGFANPSWVLVVSVLIISAAIAGSGVLYRLSLEMIGHLRGGFPSELATLSLAGLLMGPAVPNATSRVIIIAPMLRELVESLGYRPQSKAAAGLAMAALIGFGQMAAVFLTSSTTAVLVAAVLPADARANVNWLTWAGYGAPMNIILFVGIVVSLVWLYRPTTGELRPASDHSALLALQRALIGPMSRDEKIALGVGVGLLVGFMTQPMHGVAPAWVAVLATGVLAATRVITVDTLRAVNWNFALLYGVLISLAVVFERTGLNRWLTDRITAGAGDVPAAPIVFVLLLALLCFALSFVVRWQAAAPLITIALAPVAMASGIHPFVVGVIAVIACNGFFLPYQSTTYLALHAGTGGKLFTHAQARPAALAYGVWTIVAVGLSVPVWRWMGLL